MPPDATLIVVATRGGAVARSTTIRAVHRAEPEAFIVVLVPGESGDLHRALAAGAHGVVRERDLSTALVPTLVAVFAGQVVIPPERRPRVSRVPLSHREKQILELVTIGLTNGEIADRLFLAESTVKSHLNSTYVKLGVHTRNEAAALALDPESKLGLRLPPAGEPAADADQPAAA